MSGCEQPHDHREHETGLHTEHGLDEHVHGPHFPEQSQLPEHTIEIKHAHACEADCPDHRQSNHQENGDNISRENAHEPKHHIEQKPHACGADCHEHGSASSVHEHSSSVEKNRLAPPIIERKPHACTADCPEHGSQHHAEHSHRPEKAHAPAVELKNQCCGVDGPHVHHGEHEHAHEKPHEQARQGRREHSTAAIEHTHHQHDKKHAEVPVADIAPAVEKQRAETIPDNYVLAEEALRRTEAEVKQKELAADVTQAVNAQAVKIRAEHSEQADVNNHAERHMDKNLEAVAEKTNEVAESVEPAAAVRVRNSEPITETETVNNETHVQPQAEIVEDHPTQQTSKTLMNREGASISEPTYEGQNVVSAGETTDFQDADTLEVSKLAIAESYADIEDESAPAERELDLAEGEATPILAAVDGSVDVPTSHFEQFESQLDVPMIPEKGAADSERAEHVILPAPLQYAETDELVEKTIDVAADSIGLTEPQNTEQNIELGERAVPAELEALTAAITERYKGELRKRADNVETTSPQFARLATSIEQLSTTKNRLPVEAAHALILEQLQLLGFERPMQTLQYYHTHYGEEFLHDILNHLRQLIVDGNTFESIGGHARPTAATFRHGDDITATVGKFVLLIFGNKARFSTQV
ncbi:MAG TPA: hypothetical protein VF575_05505 [Candidatus Saccharimonadales bacterium]|jgi:hypothetical protein